MAEREGSRVLTVPNAISILRLGCVPLFLWLLFGRDRPVVAAWLLAALGATDWVDGYVARRFHQVSELGKVLDPLADRILLGTVVIALLVDGTLSPWVGVTALVREILVSGAVLALAAAGARRIDVQWAGKAGTLALMVAFPLFMVDGSSGPGRLWGLLAWGFALVGLAFQWYAAFTYVPIARQALTEGRAARAAPAAPAAETP
jgi:cardiolipin synthase (CMP-forming)